MPCDGHDHTFGPQPMSLSLAVASAPRIRRAPPPQSPRVSRRSKKQVTRRGPHTGVLLAQRVENIMRRCFLRNPHGYGQREATLRRDVGVLNPGSRRCKHIDDSNVVAGNDHHVYFTASVTTSAPNRPSLTWVRPLTWVSSESSCQCCGARPCDTSHRLWRATPCTGACNLLPLARWRRRRGPTPGLVRRFRHGTCPRSSSATRRPSFM